MRFQLKQCDITMSAKPVHGSTCPMATMFLRYGLTLHVGKYGVFETDEFGMRDYSDPLTVLPAPMRQFVRSVDCGEPVFPTEFHMSAEKFMPRIK